MCSKSVSAPFILCLVLVNAVTSELVINVRLNQQNDKNFDFLDENGLSSQNLGTVDESEPMGFIR
jgi:hypothetical protein